MGDDPVILALRAALGAGESVEIRVALGDRWLALGNPSAALVEYEHALRAAPQHAGALDGAIRAATAAGDAAKAAAYRLAGGRRPAAGSSPPAAPTPPAAVATGSPDPGAPILRLVPRDKIDADESPEPAQPVITFADVGGMDGVKQRLDRAFLAPVRNPEMFKSFGREIRGGLILFGPPGCGKTFIARALAGEIGAKFFDVGISDILDMWIGSSERNLHELFDNARQSQPAVVFLDEVDALGQRRTQLRHAPHLRNVVNQLLAELDGSKSRNTGVFVLGATNHPWDLDPALRRPGRFDQLVFVPPPDERARREILRLKLAGRPLAPGLELGAIAAATDGFSGADLQALVDLATDLAIEETMRGGHQHPIDSADLTKAAKTVKPSSRAWLETARNYAVYSNEGGALDDLLAYLKKVGMV